MGWIYYNPNPFGKNTIDCVVRAISIAEGIPWDKAHEALSKKARDEADMPSVNPVWADYLEEKGYKLFGLPNTCPRCYTVRDFANDYNHGTYVLGTGSHAVAVIDGNYIDTWDSGNEVPMYFFMKPTQKGDERNVNKSTELQHSGDTKQPPGVTTDSVNNASSNPTSNSGVIPGAGVAGGSVIPPQ